MTSRLQFGSMFASPVGPQGQDQLTPDSADMTKAEQLMTSLDLIFEQTEKLKAEIATKRAALAELEQQVSQQSQELASIAEQTGCELHSGYYRITVRQVKGRQSVSWDAEKLAQSLTPELGKLVLTEVTTWQANATLLNALAESGKLPEQALEARTVKPGVNRFKVERL